MRTDDFEEYNLGNVKTGEPQQLYRCRYSLGLTDQVQLMISDFTELFGIDNKGDPGEEPGPDDNNTASCAEYVSRDIAWEIWRSTDLDPGIFGHENSG